MKYLKYVVLLIITFMYTSIVSAGGGGDIQQNNMPSWTSWYSVSMEYGTGEIGPTYVNDSNGISTFVFVTRENNKSIVYQKGNIIGKYDAVDNLTFNEDNKLFFRAKLGNKQFIVIDNKKEKEYDGIGGIQVRYGTGKTDYSYSYIGIKNNKYYLVYNGIESKGYEYINELPYFNYNDYSKIIYTVKDKNGFFLIVNGRSIIKRYKDIWAGDVSVNGDFLNIAILNSGEYTLLVNGITEIGKYFNIYNVIFSPDGKDFYYIFQKEEGDKFHVGFNFKGLDDGYDNVQQINYSPLGKLFIQWVSNEGKSYYIINGKIENKYDGVSYLTYSDDEKNYTYFGLNGETWIPVVNGNEIK